jgi:magnesium transporter
VAIAIFVPAILAMGGNTGMQASAVAIRGIALGRRAYGRLFRIVWREIRVGFLLGLVCGSCTVAAVLAILVLSHADTGGYPPWMLALTVGGAMANAMTFASAFGSLVPIVLHRLNVDPALASGPFVTTSTDLSASLIYFLSCAVVLRGVSG